MNIKETNETTFEKKFKDSLETILSTENPIKIDDNQYSTKGDLINIPWLLNEMTRDANHMVCTLTDLITITLMSKEHITPTNSLIADRLLDLRKKIRESAKLANRELSLRKL